MLKKKLQGIKQKDSNLYDHLVTVLKHLILANDKDGYHMFEYYCQNANNLPNALQKQYRNEQLTSQLLEFINKQTQLLNKPSTGTQQQPIEVGPCGYIPNLTAQNKIFQKAGVGLGEQLTYIVFKSLERFSINKQIKELKFWGKINCQEKDYFIAESPAEAGEQAELPPEVQPKGTGINRTTYWVCVDLLSANWIQLPLITPEQLKVSRRIKYTFSGILEKKVYTNPFFAGTEAHLLKCQLVRIGFNCNIVPRTMYTINEDSKQIQPTQQWKMPAFQFLASLDNWVHLSQNILLNGRTTLIKPQPAQGQEIDEEKVMKELQAKDPLEQKLKPLSKDKQNSWAMRTLGDCNEYRAMSRNIEYVNNGYIHLKNLVWRGWHMIYHDKQWTSIYVGDGSKYTGEWFYPKEPQIVLHETQDRQQVDQPNFPPQEPKPQGQAGEEKPQSDGE